jgi:hypothetical protein
MYINRKCEGSKKVASIGECPILQPIGTASYFSVRFLIMFLVLKRGRFLGFFHFDEPYR